MRLFILCLFIALGACSSTSQTFVEDVEPAPIPAELEAVATSGWTGEAINAAHWYCLQEAIRHCPASYTRSCQAYQRAFVKSCMVSFEVPPDHIRLLLER